MPLAPWATLVSKQTLSRTSISRLQQALNPRSFSLSHAMSIPPDFPTMDRKPIWMKFRDRQRQRNEAARRSAPEQRGASVGRPEKEQNTTDRATTVKCRIELSLNEQCLGLIQEVLTDADNRACRDANENTPAQLQEQAVETLRFRRWRKQHMHFADADKRSMELQVQVCLFHVLKSQW